MARIHPTAIVASGATLADDVEVGPYSIIENEVSLGSGCRVGPHVVLKGPTKLGRDNRIWQFVSLGDDPQDKKYHGERSYLEIGYAEMRWDPTDSKPVASQKTCMKATRCSAADIGFSISMSP